MCGRSSGRFAERVDAGLLTVIYDMCMLHGSDFCSAIMLPVWLVIKSQS